MPTIHVLPVHLVNKIAAGEVIERPASIVKELVENSLDAGASRIEVVIEDGGKRLIRVTDNGSGMDADDLALAFVPHATSKIQADEDLFAIDTMGFRGEALASIASISHANVRTRRASEISGYEIDASGEEVGQPRPCAAAQGTTITVADLFFNTPGRRKFLKSANTEAGHVTEQIIRLALPHPQVAFSLTHNGKLTQNFPASDSTAQRIADIFGADLASKMLPIASRQGRSVKVAGMIGKPEASRASSAYQYFFLNGRYIRDRLLSHALKESYRGLCEGSRFPVAMAFLQVDPAEVDVNVHPTKVEVRFRDGQAVHGDLLAALRETLNRAQLTPSVSIDIAASPAVALADLPAELSAPDAALAQQALGNDDFPPSDDAARQRRDSLRQALADFFKTAPRPQARLNFPTDEPRPPQSQNDVAAPAQIPADDGAVFVPQSQADAMPMLQMHDSYIVVQSEDGIEIIDQHALHERLIYNDLRRRFTQGALESQRLLIPACLDASPAQLGCIEEHAELLGKLGLEIFSFAPGSAAVHAMPALLVARQADPAELGREVLDKLARGASDEELLEALLETMACKAAVKAGNPLAMAEIRDLVARRQEADRGTACPHGRPTALKITLKDLGKQFKRT